MFSSIIGKLKELTQPNDALLPSPMPTDGQGNDTEEDGFLVVGETRSERTTIVGNEFNSATVDAPPSYNQSVIFPVSQDLDMPVPEYPADAYSIIATSTNSNMTAISDLPFQLGPRMAVLKDIQEKNYFSLLAKNTHFNWNSYDYDFKTEMSILNEFGGGEIESSLLSRTYTQY
ncbi:hypothetical protein SNE40_023267 [Patella caerulea]|uniref:UMA domain-containing protein n=1 Tax=Patella caerulea TaxID=87958 RepID=A0AAN8FY69_PATCE